MNSRGIGPAFPAGMVWLVGAGPGDPGLLTLHAVNALERADVVVHDSLINSAVFDHCRPDAVRIHSGKRGGRPSPQQTDISARLIALSHQGKRVVRLKGGDPFIFGRGSEEILALIRSGVPVRVTPGVSSGYGGLAYAGLPLTSRETNQCVTFLTGHDRFGATPSPIDWRQFPKGSRGFVMYWAWKNFGPRV
ncbi:MAG: uroporphyrinogen-III C-methyltransferase, partial [Rhodobacteraceae bacterium]|nr:uroporphyrinogen-III C-methyltransferase [Paracoccaceae bacterium]